jgi:hypothetical protein
MLKARIPDILLGAILGSSIVAMGSFAAGFLLGSSQYPSPSVQSSRPEPTSSSNSNDEQQEGFWQAITTDPIAVFTLCLVLVGLVQLRLFYVQLRLIRQSLDPAQIAANAAKKSADSLRNIERAYVFIDYELLRERNTALKEGGIRNKQIALVFKNFGRTPAVVNGINGKCLYSPNRYLPKIESASMKIPSGIAIGSGSPWSIPVFFAGTQCHINEAMSGAGSIYLYGEIAYRDMLGEQTRDGILLRVELCSGAVLHGSRH